VTAFNAPIDASATLLPLVGRSLPKKHSRIEAAICATCAPLGVRAFRAYGTS
jgi:hypothetical protein